MPTARPVTRRAPWRARVAFLLLALGLCELGARVLVARRPELLLTPESSAGRRLHWVDERSRRDPSSAFVTFMEHDPQLGWAPRPGLRGVAWKGEPLDTTSRGFRGAAELVPGGEHGRVVVIGDSFTFGEGVGEGHTYVDQARRFLPRRAEVLNLGVPGFGHDQMLLRLERDGLPLEPDVVVLGFVSLDMVRNLLDFRDFAKPRFRLRGGELALTNVPVPEPPQLFARARWSSRGLALLEILAVRAEEASGRRVERARDVTRALVTRMADSCRAAGSRFAIMYMPWWAEFEAPQAAPAETFVVELAADLDVPLLNLGPRLREAYASGQADFTRGHWGAAEHYMAGRDLGRWLASHFPRRLRRGQGSA